MYLSHQELVHLLNNSPFTQPVTESQTAYKFYQGRLSTTVFTVRFNLESNFSSPDAMINYLNRVLPLYFKEESKILCCVYWDLVLRGAMTPITFIEPIPFGFNRMKVVKQRSD